MKGSSPLAAEVFRAVRRWRASPDSCPRPSKSDRGGLNVTIVRCVIATLSIAVMIGCGPPPAGPTDPLSGRWSGAIVDRAAGTGVLQLDLTQSQGAVTGSWIATFSSGGPNGSGTVGGTLGGSNLLLSLVPQTMLACAGGVKLSGTITLVGSVDADHLKGTYSAFTCGGAAAGTVDLTRP
jgi:hypothetical protein